MAMRAALANAILLVSAALPPCVSALRLESLHAARALMTSRRAAPCMAERKRRQVAGNRLARRNFDIIEEFEAGVSLVGTEVKSCRAGRCNLRDGFCRIKDEECWLHNVNIARHETAGGFFQHEETRPRRLLLHKREIRKLAAAVDQKGLTIVPLSCYFNEQSYLKVQIALARGKNKQDQRETIKRRDADREIGRQLKAFR